VNGNIIIRSAAARDLEGHADYLGGRSLAVALRFADRVAETFRELAAMPGIGSLRPVANPALAGLRTWRVRDFGDYLIFYRPTDQGIEILRVLHGARDIDSILAE
jgi:toxin ParE1/3/4